MYVYFDFVSAVALPRRREYLFLPLVFCVGQVVIRMGTGYPLQFTPEARIISQESMPR